MNTTMILLGLFTLILAMVCINFFQARGYIIKGETELNSIIRDLEEEKNSLAREYQTIMNHLNLYKSVNGGLKNTVEDLSIKATDLKIQLEDHIRSMDGLQQEIVYLKHPPQEPIPPTEDELDAWHNDVVAPAPQPDLPTTIGQQINAYFPQDGDLKS